MLLWAAGARRPEVEEALQPLDVHCTVSRARIVHMLTKLTKPFVPVNLVGPVNLVDIVWGVFFFGRNKEALPCVRRYSWWVRAVSDGNVFSAKYRGPFDGSQMSGGGIIILRVTRRHFLACGRGPSCQPLHVQSTLDACRSLTTLTMPR